MMRLHDAIIALKDHFQSYNPDARYRIDLNLDANGVSDEEEDSENNIADRLKRYRNKRIFL